MLTILLIYACIYILSKIFMNNYAQLNYISGSIFFLTVIIKQSRFNVSYNQDYTVLNLSSIFVSNICFYKFITNTDIMYCIFIYSIKID